MRVWISAVVAVALILPVEAAGSKKKPIPAQLHWSELAPVVTGETVAIAAPEGGPWIEGQVIVVEPDALRLQIKKGEKRILRASITAIELRQMRKSGRIAGTATGGVLGAAGVLAVAIGSCRLGPLLLHNTCDVPGAGVVAAIAIGIGFPVAGYFLGNWFDRKYTRITILPDTP